MNSEVKTKKNIINIRMQIALASVVVFLMIVSASVNAFASENTAENTNSAVVLPPEIVQTLPAQSDKQISTTTDVADKIGGNSATLRGKLNGLEADSAVKVYFGWGETESYGNVQKAKIDETGNISLELPFLRPNTTYYYRAKAVGNTTVYGEGKTFTTTGVTLVLLPPTEKVKVNSTFPVDIQLIAEGQPVDGTDIFVNFDACVLEAVSIAPNGGLIPVASNIDNTNGHINYSALAPIGRQPGGTFTVATITFQPKIAVKETRVSFNRELPRKTNVAAGKGSVLGEVIDGIIDRIQSTETDVEPEKPAVNQNKQVLIADINQDGNIDALDITTWERIMAGLVILPEGIDANGDGMADFMDITRLERIITGLDRLDY